MVEKKEQGQNVEQEKQMKKKAVFPKENPEI